MIELTPAQNEIAIDRHRFRVVCCGRRFGKTTLAVLEMVAKAVYKSDARIAYIAPNYQQARDIAWMELKKICKPIANKINESRLEIIVNNTKGGTSVISLRGWESIETLRGQLFDFIVIDEVASMRNFESMWQEVVRPTLTDRSGEALFISTPKGFNHFYDLFNKQGGARPDTDYKSFHFTSYSNPHIKKEEFDKAQQELTPDRFAQEYLADFRKAEGLVFKEFSREKHLFNEEVHGDKMAGIDFGFTNPTAVISIVKDYDATYWVTDEWYKVGKTNDEIADYVVQQDYSKVYPDPASPGAIAELRKRGVNVKEVIKSKTNNKSSIVTGIDKLKTLFNENRLRIHQSCTNLIFELENYSYPEGKQNRNESELPVDDMNHAIDALRYACMMDKATNRVGVSYNHSPVGNPLKHKTSSYTGGSTVGGKRTASTYIPTRL
jgi:PBSX family phage terminase large subunit